MSLLNELETAAPLIRRLVCREQAGVLTFAESILAKL